MTHPAQINAHTPLTTPETHWAKGHCRNGTLLTGKFSLRRRSLTRKVSGVTRSVRAFIWAGLPRRVYRTIGGRGGKRARSRTETGTLSTGNFSHFTGLIDRWVSVVTRSAWAWIWAGLPRRVIELSGTSEKAGPFDNENGVANFWEFQLLHGPRRPLGIGRYRRGLAFARAGLPE